MASFTPAFDKIIHNEGGLQLIGTPAKLAQNVVGTVADGNIGPVTQEKLNALDEAVFVTKYALTKVARYAQICNKDRSQTKFLLGWINRTIGGLT